MVTNLIWTVETLDTTGVAGIYSSLALCTTYEPGAPRIGYYGNGVLNYAHKFFFGGWSIATLDSDAPAGISFVLSPLCQPHVSYYDGFHARLKYTYEDVSGWHTEVVDDQVDGGDWWSSLVLDSAGRPHISYVGNWPPYGMGLKYAYKPYLAYLPLVLRNFP